MAAWRSPTRKDWAKALQVQHDISVVLSCVITGMSRTAFYYQPKRCDDSEVITVLNTLVERHQRWGVSKCFKRIRALGYRWNHKRVQRVYNALRLNIKTKRKQRVPARQPEPLVVPKSTGQCWSMDFMSDRSENNVRFRTFNVIDDCNRELLGIDIGTGLPSARVTRYLDKPNSLVFTHQTETKEVVKARDKALVKVGYKNSTRLKRKST